MSVIISMNIREFSIDPRDINVIGIRIRFVQQFQNDAESGAPQEIPFGREVRVSALFARLSDQFDAAGAHHHAQQCAAARVSHVFQDVQAQPGFEGTVPLGRRIRPTGLNQLTFAFLSNPQFHINQHTGDKPYKCPHCPKAFASSGNCFSHRKRMHADKDKI